VVAAGGRRDTEQLRAGIAAWLAAVDASAGRAGDSAGPPQVVALSHAAAGWSAETVLVTVQRGGDGPSERLVIRLPPVDPSFPGLSLGAQATAQQAAGAGGVPVPAPVLFEPDEAWLGAPFLAMPFVAGHVPGQAPALDPWVTGSGEALQRRLFENLLEVMANLHRADWTGAGLGGWLRGGREALAGRPTLHGELAWWRAYLSWSDERTGGASAAVLADGMARCEEGRPHEEPAPSLLWGDPRLGNLVVDDDRSVAAVLDWELVSIGPAEMDLAWLLVLQWSTDTLIGSEVPGFPDHDESVTCFESMLGRRVLDLGWHELFALTRTAAISNHQARMAARLGSDYVVGPDGENPMLQLLARRLGDAMT
jgi:aminoglycoside phosphotransferase (APT) family kinase protein